MDWAEPAWELPARALPGTVDAPRRASDTPSTDAFLFARWVDEDAPEADPARHLTAEGTPPRRFVDAAIDGRPTRAILPPEPVLAATPIRPHSPAQSSGSSWPYSPGSPAEPTVNPTAKPAPSVGAERWRHISELRPDARATPYVPARSAASPSRPNAEAARRASAPVASQGPRRGAPKATRRRLPLVAGAAGALGVAAVAVALAASSLSGPAGGGTPLLATPATSVAPAPAGTQAAAASPTPTAIATTYAPGAFAVPQTGGMRLVPTASGPLSGKVIVLDPGHNGQFKYSINERSSYTFGAGWRPCVQGGTTTAKGVTEHEIVWQIANKVAPLLLAQGATVVLTRADDAGIGPCNSERPEIANREGASLFLSIHVDGNTTTSLRGFHVTWSPLMAGGAATSTASEKAARILADAMLAGTKLPGSNYMQDAGVPIIKRSDLSVLDGVRGAPAVLIETGNGRNPDDEDILTTDAGQQSVALALASAAAQIVTTLPANTTIGPASASPSAPPGASTPTASSKG